MAVRLFRRLAFIFATCAVLFARFKKNGWL